MMVTAACRHSFCADCWPILVAHYETCPMCRAHLKKA
jgi:hypothetical protein